MGPIEEAYADCEERLVTPRWADRAEMLAAIRVAMMAVLEEAVGVKEHFRIAPLGTCTCRSCTMRARIAALGAPQRPPDGQERAKGA